MQIVLQDAGKRFNRDWIFRKLSFTFNSGQSYAITGPNGSGKSTLLQAIAGAITIAEGTVKYIVNGNIVPGEGMYKQISVVAPYLELVEEMTATEFLMFHQTFKPFIEGVTADSILQFVDLEKAAIKQIRYFSSGMKQRLRLAQAIFSNVPVVLLDEPCTNLDAPGYHLYHTLINNYCSNRLIIISSNDANEYDFCTTRLNILDYKKP
jgi:ABC-type multidrug transport system ATPase subunit